MKKQGNILIEVVASMMILILTSAFIVSTSMQNARVLEERMLLEEVNRAVCNLTNEFKYNLSKAEIEELLIDDQIGFKYKQDFSNRLVNTEIKDLEQGGDIEVSKIEDSGIGIKIKIRANIRNEKIRVKVENEFTKSWWMDEI